MIRVKVIAESLISQEDFQAVQRIMDLKQAKHWRAQPGVERRFTYNGFLSCAVCGEVVHTALARRDYYACKGRRAAHICGTKYMGRERLERHLDSLFADHLTSPHFLEVCIEEMERRHEHDDSAAQVRRLVAQVSSLREKRGRVMDAFLEGAIGREDRNLRLAAIDRDTQSAEDLIARSNPTVLISLKSLVEAFAPLHEWGCWSRDQKRSVLSAIVPDIRVADY